VDNGIKGQTYVVEKGAGYWQQLRQWVAAIEFLSPKEISILQIACEMPNKLPSHKQSKILLEIEKKAIKEGFPANS
jgi:hypothetical protein